MRKYYLGHLMLFIAHALSNHLYMHEQPPVGINYLDFGPYVIPSRYFVCTDSFMNGSEEIAHLCRLD